MKKLLAKLPAQKHLAPACFAGPICCEKAAASIFYDEPASCKEAHSEGVPCGKAPCEETPKPVCYEEPICCEEATSCKEVSCGEALYGEGSRDEVAEAVMRDKRFLVTRVSCLLEQLAEDNLRTG